MTNNVDLPVTLPLPEKDVKDIDIRDEMEININLKEDVRPHLFTSAGEDEVVERVVVDKTLIVRLYEAITENDS